MTKSKSILIETKYNKPETVLLSTFLKEDCNISGHSLRQYFFKGLIFLNGKKAHSQAKIKTGDIIKVLRAKEEHPKLSSEDVPLDIVFENDDLLVINKPALLAVHPSGKITSGTLSNRVAAYFEKNKIKSKVRPVNRLDYGTSGLIIFAKSAQIQARLSEAIRKHRLNRIYQAVVKGVPNPPNGVIDLPITHKNQRRFVGSDGQQAETHYRVINIFKESSLVELQLKTGRTHQIRVHLSHIGHPICGDLQYGVKSPWINRPALHAYKLEFSHSDFSIPDLVAELPEDILKLCRNL